jgi:hypothetical protein
MLSDETLLDAGKGKRVPLAEEFPGKVDQRGGREDESVAVETVDEPFRPDRAARLSDRASGSRIAAAEPL